jgi:hypothetical protein
MGHKQTEIFRTLVVGYYNDHTVGFWIAKWELHTRWGLGLFTCLVADVPPGQRNGQ